MNVPIIAAPMAGGPTTPELVIAAAQAGGLGFLAAGYKTPEQLAEQIATVRAATDQFGVNLFAPNPIPVEREDFATFAQVLEPIAQRFDVELAGEPREDDDAWAAKVDLLVHDPVPVVSFTFGLPDSEVVRRLQAVGTLTVQTVTGVEEAVQAAERGVDALAVQAAAAGGHSGTWSPDRPLPETPLAQLVAQVAAAVNLPIFAAGGITQPEHVRDVLEAGATAAVVGTALLRTPEAGTSAPHKAALADPKDRQTVMTRAFSGRPARALRNEFTEAYSAVAPAGFPALHHLTSPLRKAATAASEPEFINLWAGTGFRDATEEPAATVIRRLGGAIEQRNRTVRP